MAVVTDIRTKQRPAPEVSWPVREHMRIVPYFAAAYDVGFRVIRRSDGGFVFSGQAPSLPERVPGLPHLRNLYDQAQADFAAAMQEFAVVFPRICEAVAAGVIDLSGEHPIVRDGRGNSWPLASPVWCNVCASCGVPRQDHGAAHTA